MVVDLSSRLVAVGYKASIEDLLAEIRRLPYDQTLVPLGIHRLPFVDVGDRALVAFIEHVFDCPEALGRMSLTLRRHLGIAVPCPIGYVIKESHFDVSDISNGLQDDLIALGFEADHFAELNPPEYKWCFTMKYEIPRGPFSHERVHKLDSILLQRSMEAQRIIDAHPTCFGYLEIESYSSENKKLYQYRVPTSSSLESFPFNMGDFEVIRLPDGPADANSRGLALDTHKFVDVHVKLPAPARREEFEGTDSAAMRALRNLFLEAGFYEIYSEAGNYIYTVQSTDVSKAKVVFRALDSFATLGVGIIGLKLEICKYFWRKSRPDRPEVVLAPVPPITRIQPHAYARLSVS